MRPPIHQQEPYRKPSGGIDLLTSYTKDYPGRKAEAVKSFRGDHTRHVPSGEFRGNPTYAGKSRIRIVFIYTENVEKKALKTLDTIGNIVKDQSSQFVYLNISQQIWAQLVVEVARQ